MTFHMQRGRSSENDSVYAGEHLWKESAPFLRTRGLRVVQHG